MRHNSATLPTRNTEHRTPSLRSGWSAESPWCQCCGRTDRFHVRWGLCYVCADLDTEWMAFRLGLDIQNELRELPGQCREAYPNSVPLSRLLEGIHEGFMPYEGPRVSERASGRDKWTYN